MKKMNYAILFVGTVALDLILVGLAWLSFFRLRDLSSTALFIMGVAAVLTGVFVLAGQVTRKLQVGGVLVLLGMYFFARAAGVIKQSWLALVAGIAALAAAGFLTYLAARRVESGADTHHD